mmetsp:Transcript_62230/g.165225  ORF Transcript_62230/g.165225 Transcript_62230/m.165225 type:complete len:205 (+) Transcript_62230:62-676(+)
MRGHPLPGLSSASRLRGGLSCHSDAQERPIKTPGRTKRRPQLRLSHRRPRFNRRRTLHGCRQDVWPRHQSQSSCGQTAPWVQRRISHLQTQGCLSAQHPVIAPLLLQPGNNIGRRLAMRQRSTMPLSVFRQVAAQCTYHPSVRYDRSRHDVVVSRNNRGNRRNIFMTSIQKEMFTSGETARAPRFPSQSGRQAVLCHGNTRLVC